MLLVGRTMAPTTLQQQRHATFASRRRQQPAPYVGIPTHMDGLHK